MPQPLEIAVDPDVYLRPNYSDDWHSETTSIGSSIYHGLMENGRRYVSSYIWRTWEVDPLLIYLLSIGIKL
ncbi:hypothetical protein DTO012A8_10245 [Penicillium roqueforti]|nr:hypothetical protein DTO012A8_10245 [Penicillium roqueforti]